PQWLDTRTLADAAAQRGILIEPGDVFFMSDDPPRNHMRLGFSSIDAAKIDAGIRELGAVMHEFADNVSRASETAAH
ncbi:MAG TPA: PLP-dependent aminotransferase family protein, partial [Burkholderiales bacterium]|nr:PLP-dependent aminotransferase family protein [Burkholderiales bacterium]